MQEKGRKGPPPLYWVFLSRSRRRRHHGPGPNPAFRSLETMRSRPRPQQRRNGLGLSSPLPLISPARLRPRTNARGTRCGKNMAGEAEARIGTAGDRMVVMWLAFPKGAKSARHNLLLKVRCADVHQRRCVCVRVNCARGLAGVLREK